MSLGFSRNEIPGQVQEDRSKYFRAAFNHQFSPKMSGSMYYQRLQNDSSVSTADYTENQVSAQLQMRF
jgi:uncharacterized protein (PEP-CTERM system associated)